MQRKLIFVLLLALTIGLIVHGQQQVSSGQALVPHLPILDPQAPLISWFAGSLFCEEGCGVDDTLSFLALMSLSPKTLEVSFVDILFYDQATNQPLIQLEEGRTKLTIPLTNNRFDDIKVPWINAIPKGTSVAFRGAMTYSNSLPGEIVDASRLTYIPKNARPQAIYLQNRIAQPGASTAYNDGIWTDAEDFGVNGQFIASYNNLAETTVALQLHLIGGHQFINDETIVADDKYYCIINGNRAEIKTGGGNGDNTGLVLLFPNTPVLKNQGLTVYCNIQLLQPKSNQVNPRTLQGYLQTNFVTAEQYDKALDFTFPFTYIFTRALFNVIDPYPVSPMDSQVAIYGDVIVIDYNFEYQGISIADIAKTIKSETFGLQIDTGIANNNDFTLNSTNARLFIAKQDNKKQYVISQRIDGLLPVQHTSSPSSTVWDYETFPITFNTDITTLDNIGIQPKATLRITIPIQYKTQDNINYEKLNIIMNHLRPVAQDPQFVYPTYLTPSSLSTNHIIHQRAAQKIFMYYTVDTLEPNVDLKKLPFEFALVGILSDTHIIKLQTLTLDYEFIGKPQDCIAQQAIYNWTTNELKPIGTTFHLNGKLLNNENNNMNNGIELSVDTKSADNTTFSIGQDWIFTCNTVYYIQNTATVLGSKLNTTNNIIISTSSYNTPDIVSSNGIYIDLTNTKPTPTPPSPTPKPKPTSHKFRNTIFVLILLFALGVVGYFVWKHQEQERKRQSSPQHQQLIGDDYDGEYATIN